MTDIEANLCQYWSANEPVRCKYWHPTEDYCKYASTDGATGRVNKAFYAPYCNFVGTLYSCPQYTPDREAEEGTIQREARCIAPDAGRVNPDRVGPVNEYWGAVGGDTVVRYGAGKFAKVTTEAVYDANGSLSVIPVIDYSNISCYGKDGKCTGCKASHNTKDGKSPSCTAYNPQHLGFDKFLPDIYPFNRNIDEYTAVDDSSNYGFSHGRELGGTPPLHFRVYNERAKISRCFWWEDNSGEFYVDGLTDSIVFSLTDPDATTACTCTDPLCEEYKVWHFDEVRGGIKSAPCNGAKPECPFYASSVYWEYCIDENMKPGDKVLAEQIFELRYYLRRSMWTEDSYNKSFNNPDLYVWAGSTDIEYDENFYPTGNYAIPSQHVTMTNFESFNVDKKSILLGRGTPAPPMFPTFVETLQTAEMPLFICNKFDIDPETGGNIFEVTDLTHKYMTIIGEMYWYNTDVYAINLSDPDVVKVNLPVEKFKQYRDMLLLRIEMSDTLFDDFYEDLDCKLTNLITYCPDKAVLSAYGRHNNFFWINTPTFFGNNDILVVSKGGGTWQYSMISVKKIFVGGIIAQTNFSVRGEYDGEESPPTIDYLPFYESNFMTSENTITTDEGVVSNGLIEFKFIPFNTPDCTPELCYIFNDSVVESMKTETFPYGGRIILTNDDFEKNTRYVAPYATLDDGTPVYYYDDYAEAFEYGTSTSYIPDAIVDKVYELNLLGNLYASWASYYTALNTLLEEESYDTKYSYWNDHALRGDWFFYKYQMSGCPILNSMPADLNDFWAAYPADISCNGVSSDGDVQRMTIYDYEAAYKLFRIKQSDGDIKPSSSLNTSSAGNLQCIGNAGVCVVTVPDPHNQLTNTIRPWSINGEYENSRIDLNVVIERYDPITGSEVTAVDMVIPEGGKGNDSLPDNQFVLMPRDSGAWYSPNGAVVSDVTVHYYEKHSWGEIPQPPEDLEGDFDYVEVVDDKITGRYPEAEPVLPDETFTLPRGSDYVLEEGTPGELVNAKINYIDDDGNTATLEYDKVTNTYRIRGFDVHPLLISVVFKSSVTGKMRGITRTKMVLWVRQPYCSDVWMRHGWNSGYHADGLTNYPEQSSNLDEGEVVWRVHNDHWVRFNYWNSNWPGYFNGFLYSGTYPYLGWSPQDIALHISLKPYHHSVVGVSSYDFMGVPSWNGSHWDPVGQYACSCHFKTGFLMSEFSNGWSFSYTPMKYFVVSDWESAESEEKHGFYDMRMMSVPPAELTGSCMGTKGGGIVAMTDGEWICTEWGPEECWTPGHWDGLTYIPPELYPCPGEDVCLSGYYEQIPNPDPPYDYGSGKILRTVPDYQWGGVGMYLGGVTSKIVDREPLYTSTDEPWLWWRANAGIVGYHERVNLSFQGALIRRKIKANSLAKERTDKLGKPWIYTPPAEQFRPTPLKFGDVTRDFLLSFRTIDNVYYDKMGRIHAINYPDVKARRDRMSDEEGSSGTIVGILDSSGNRIQRIRDNNNVLGTTSVAGSDAEFVGVKIPDYYYRKWVPINYAYTECNITGDISDYPFNHYTKEVNSPLIHPMGLFMVSSTEDEEGAEIGGSIENVKIDEDFLRDVNGDPLSFRFETIFNTDTLDVEDMYAEAESTRSPKEGFPSHDADNPISLVHPEPIYMNLDFGNNYPHNASWYVYRNLFGYEAFVEDESVAGKPSDWGKGVSFTDDVIAVQWAWRGLWKEIERELSTLFFESLLDTTGYGCIPIDDGEPVEDEVLVVPYLESEEDACGVVGIFGFATNLSYPEYIMDGELFEHRLVCAQGSHTLRFIPPQRDEDTGDYLFDVFFLQLDEGPPRGFTLWETGPDSGDNGYWDPAVMNDEALSVKGFTGDVLYELYTTCAEEPWVGDSIMTLFTTSYNDFETSLADADGRVINPKCKIESKIGGSYDNGHSHWPSAMFYEISQDTAMYYQRGLLVELDVDKVYLFPRKHILSESDYEFSFGYGGGLPKTPPCIEPPCDETYYASFDNRHYEGGVITLDWFPGDSREFNVEFNCDGGTPYFEVVFDWSKGNGDGMKQCVSRVECVFDVGELIVGDEKYLYHVPAVEVWSRDGYTVGNGACIHTYSEDMILYKPDGSNLDDLESNKICRCDIDVSTSAIMCPERYFRIKCRLTPSESERDSYDYNVDDYINRIKLKYIYVYYTEFVEAVEYINTYERKYYVSVGTYGDFYPNNLFPTWLDRAELVDSPAYQIPNLPQRRYKHEFFHGNPPTQFAGEDPYSMLDLEDGASFSYYKDPDYTSEYQRHRVSSVYEVDNNEGALGYYSSGSESDSMNKCRGRVMSAVHGNYISLGNINSKKDIHRSECLQADNYNTIIDRGSTEFIMTSVCPPGLEELFDSAGVAFKPWSCTFKNTLVPYLTPTVQFDPYQAGDYVRSHDSNQHGTSRMVYKTSEARNSDILDMSFEDTSFMRKQKDHFYNEFVTNETTFNYPYPVDAFHSMVRAACNMKHVNMFLWSEGLDGNSLSPWGKTAFQYWDSGKRGASTDDVVIDVHPGATPWDIHNNAG